EPPIILVEKVSNDEIFPRPSGWDSVGTGMLDSRMTHSATLPKRLHPSPSPCRPKGVDWYHVKATRPTPFVCATVLSRPRVAAHCSSKAIRHKNYGKTGPLFAPAEVSHVVFVHSCSIWSFARKNPVQKTNPNFIRIPPF